MADNKQHIGPGTVEALQPQVTETLKKQQEGKEVKEATISVGVEAGEIIESAEEISGNVSESENKRKEGDSGGTMTKQQSAQGTAKAKSPYPPVFKMTHQVKKQLKKDIKVLNKKVNQVMKAKGNLDAEKLNKLVEALRELRQILSNLASATAETIKNLWITHVKDRK